MSIQSYFKLKEGRPDPKGSLSTCPPTQAISLANKEAEKAVMDIGLGKKRRLYFIFIVALDAASCFVLFHAARGLKLLE